MASVEPRAEPEVAPDASVASGSLRARTSVPALSPTTAPRPDLDRLLARSDARRLTLVSAGPGWGKTTTVAAWARSRPDARTAWLTLEPFDDTPTAFWSDVLAALRASGAVPQGHPLERLDVPAGMSAELLRRILHALELLPDPVVLVLDDLHHVAGGDVTRTLDDLLRYPLPLHLVALSRIDPPLMLQRLRGQGEVLELGATELAFDAAAVASLGARHGRTLGPVEVERVLDETGGWAVGVRLQVEAPTGPAGRVRADRSAAEYLLAEVLERQDPVTRRFLLRTSLASTVCVELAAVLDPEAPAGRLLPGLAASHGFVTAVGDQRAWYRYHPLLREMLQSELRLEDPAAVPVVHGAAARWLVRHGEPVRALEHAVLSEDWGLVGDILVEGAAIHLGGPHRDAVGDLLRRVPFADLEPDVALHLCAGSLALVDERFDATNHHVARARVLLDADADADLPSTPAAVLVELLDASASRSVGDVRRLATVAGAAVAAADSVPFPFPALEAYRALARAHRATGLAWCAVPTGAPSARRPHGSAVLDESPASAAPGLPRTAEPDRALLEARSLVALGAQAAGALLDVSEGRVTAGEARARATIETARARGWETHVQSRAAHAALAWAQHLRAADAGLDRALASSLAADVGGREPASEAAVRLLQAQVAAARGHGRAARNALVAADHALGRAATPPVLADLWVRAAAEVQLLDDDSAGTGGSGAPRTSRVDREALGSPAVTAVCRARHLLAAGRSDAALRAVADVTGAPPGDVDDLTRLEAVLVEASVLARAGSRRAETAVDKALALATAEHLARPFLTVPRTELRPTLDRAVARGDEPLPAHLRSLLGRAGAGPEPVPLVEPLTERELAVLAVLPTMESNLEIAEDFFVSVNTVKAHLKALYRKLGVGTRRDAVRRGRELGILH